MVGWKELVGHGVREGVSKPWWARSYNYGRTGAARPGTFQISLERVFSRKKKISIIFSGYEVIEV